MEKQTKRNRRRPQKIENGRRPGKKKMEDDLKKKNERQPRKKWKTTSKKSGRQPQKKLKMTLKKNEK
jgi:hypothetical protein